MNSIVQSYLSLPEFWRAIWLATNSVIIVSHLSIALVLLAAALVRRDLLYRPVWFAMSGILVSHSLIQVVRTSAAFGWLTTEHTITISLLVATISATIACTLVWLAPRYSKVPSARERAKGELLKNFHHRMGNQLQVLRSMVNIESRKAESEEALTVLKKLGKQLDEYGRVHHEQSTQDYSDLIERQHAPFQPDPRTVARRVPPDSRA